MKKGFTLAETLIALGIIGVVAALTLPVLIQKHRNMVVENKLKRFYSVMQQAIKMSEAENGEMKYWYQFYGVGHKNEILEWYNNYLGKYIESVKIDITSNANAPIIYLPDGSAFTFSNPSRDIAFTTGDFQKCTKKGVNKFSFILWEDRFESYGQKGKHFSFNPSQLATLCKDINQRDYCTGYIHANGWKIPDDYPVKVRY